MEVFSTSKGKLKNFIFGVLSKVVPYIMFGFDVGTPHI